MKNIAFLIVLLVSLSFGSRVLAGSPAHPIKPQKATTTTTHAFSANDAQADAELSDLDALEQHVLTNEGTSLATVQATRPDLTANLNISTTTSPTSVQATNTHVAGIPPFFWGFFLSFIGIIIVHFTNRDILDTQMALYGALTMVGLVLFYFILTFFSPIFSLRTL